ncbi:MAG: hypothetical protein HC904_08145 [Blastochloris sp.]|nr:hypothetical protein [Blastochloris sp.]
MIKLSAQVGSSPEAGAGGSFSAPAAPAEERPKTPPKPQEMIAKIKKENSEAIARIKEIEAFVYPIQEEEAQKTFGLEKGEFTFLRMQTEVPQSASEYFQKRQSIDRDSMDGIVAFFDETYEALQAGELWVGREGGLVNEDSALYNELLTKVMEGIQKRADGEKIIKMLAERDMLLAKLKTSKPLYKYFSERRLWWKSYPDYEQTIRVNQGVKAQELEE